MQIEKANLSDTPRHLVTDTWDCVWICLEERPKASALKSTCLQWVDWKLHGQLSRLILETSKRSSETTFLPTQKKLPTPLVAVEMTDDMDWKAFLRNCEGMRLKTIVCFCENPSRVASLEKEIRRQTVLDYPSTVILASEGGRSS